MASKLTTTVNNLIVNGENISDNIIVNVHISNNYSEDYKKTRNNGMHLIVSVLNMTMTMSGTK